MKKICLLFLALNFFGCFLGQALAGVAALEKDSFVVVEQPSSSSQRISYYKIDKGKIKLQDMILVNHSLDKRITTKKLPIYIKTDVLAEELPVIEK